MRFFLRRLLQLIPVLLIVSFLTFLLLNLLPGGTTQIAVTVCPGCTNEEIAQVKSDLQLDKSTVSRRVRKARDGGYLRNLEERRGRPARLLPDGAKAAFPITDKYAHDVGQIWIEQ